MVEHTAEELTEAFMYLDELRTTGETNMFGASSYIVQDLGWPATEARSALSLWMQSYNPDLDMDERVSSVLNK